MAPLNIKEIVNVSSEDEKFPATNLMCGQKWLSNSCKQKDEVFIEVKTEIPCQVTYIDIGYFNVALLEIHVALSSWPSYREYLTLVPTVKLQSPADARSGRNKTGCKMLNFDDHMNQEIAKLDWDKFKLVLHQPYARNKQLGIEFVRLGTSKSTKNDSTVKFVVRRTYN